MTKRPPPTATRWRRPKTLAEALNQIESVYEVNDWDETESFKHRELIGLEAKPLREYSNDELKIILTDFEKHKMIAYQK